jgi:hypothetical protein
MAVFTLESLVLRGVAVLKDELAVSLRLGTSKAGVQATRIGISMREPSPGYGTNSPQGHKWPDYVDYFRVVGATPGAGRSPRPAAQPSRKPATAAGPAAGGPRSAAAACPCLLRARPVASVSEIPSRPLANHSRALPASAERGARGLLWLPVKPSWCKPAGRTPPASTRGKGGR